jgi:hypothetical protein
MESHHHTSKSSSETFKKIDEEVKFVKTREDVLAEIG